MPLILSGNVASATAAAYEVANSCRFNDDDSAYMHKTPGSDGNKKTWTFSCWIKLSKISSGSINIFSTNDGSDFSTIYLANNKLTYYDYSGGGNVNDLQTNAIFRDLSAYYNFVIRYDSTESTASDRIRFYVNGVQQTSFASSSYPSSSYDSFMNVSGYKKYIGSQDGTGDYFDGYMSEVCFIDGLALAPTSFGEFDEDSPTIWKPINVSGLTFGTNGFYLDFEASDNLGNDANGGTDLTEVNLDATDQATDTPTNNFCTMNPLDNFYFGGTFSEGNLKIVSDASVESYPTSTIGVSSGKWYWEIKVASSGSDRDQIGIGDKVADNTDFTPISDNTRVEMYYGYTGVHYSGGATTSGYGDAFGTGDIIGVAMDLDNHKLYFSKNGTFQNSGDPTSGATGTGALAIDTSPADGVYYAVFANIHNTGSTFEANFGGCPAFAITSGNADADGYGNFEYAVPSGFYALCTKNLAEYG